LPQIPLPKPRSLCEACVSEPARGSQQAEGILAKASKDPVVKTHEESGVLEQVARIVRRRKWIILQATIAVPMIALLFSLSQEKEYTAAATLLFRPPPVSVAESNNVVDPTREAATNGELVALPVVAEEAENLLDNGTSAAEIFASIQVTPSSEADTAAVSSTTNSPELSAQYANAYSRAYIRFRKSADREQVQDAIDQAESSLDELTAEQREGAEGEALGKQLDQLRLVQSLQTGGAELVQPADPPSSPSSPKTKRNVLLGLVLGLLLGFGLAALLERLDRRVRTVEELEELYRLPVVARIPRSKRLAVRTDTSIGPNTQEGEAFRVLRTNLRYLAVNRELHSILMLSPEEGDGKSTLTRGLAMTMASMGDEIVLVEADLRKGGEFRTVSGEPAPGLSNVLTGTPIEKVLLEVAPAGATDRSRHLSVISSGPIPPNPAELLESERMKEVLTELEERFSLVILDSPALSAVGDALALVPYVSGVIVIGGLGKTTRDEAAELNRQFELLDRRPIGVAANFTDPERAKYSHYYRPELAKKQAARR
jgi:capsular exopolysaccharide synthesis family protein